MVGAEPSSDWNWVVGPLNMESVKDAHQSLICKLEERLTSHDASTAVGISDTTVGVDAELSRAQATIDTVLTVIELTERALSTTRGVDVEAAVSAPANKGVGTGSEGCNGNKGLHCLLSE